MEGQRPEKIWDGRGEQLADARYTTVDGRMADDLRFTCIHFRVMAHVGRQNANRGWLRVSQTELAKRWGLGRTTVSRAFNALVEWGYLYQRSQEEAGESFCLYKVRLDGDEPLPASARQPRGGVCAVQHTPGQDVAERECALQSTPVCAVEHTGVPSQSTPPQVEVLTTRANRLSPTNADSPPNPRSRGNRGGGIDLVLETVRRADPGRARPVDKLLGPLCRQRTLTAPDVPYALGVLADWGKLRDLDDDGMAAVLERLKDERKAMVKPADVEAAVKDEAPRSEARSRRSAAVAAQQAACPPEVAATWKQVRAALAQTFGQAVFDAWFAEVVAIGLADGRLTLATPSAIHVRYINQNYTSGLVRVAQSAAPEIRTVELIVLATPHAGRAA